MPNPRFALLRYMARRTKKIRDKFFRKVTRRLPPQRVRQMDLFARLRWYNVNPEAAQFHLGLWAARSIPRVVRHRQFSAFARVQRRLESTVGGVEVPIGIFEAMVYTEVLRPIVRLYSPSLLRGAFGHLTGFDIFTQFLPSFKTNLYLVRQSGLLAPRHQWGRFLWGRSYVIPRGRPTDRQRVIDASLIALNAENPRVLGSYALLMIMILIAKELWRRFTESGGEEAPPTPRPTPLDESDPPVDPPSPPVQVEPDTGGPDGPGGPDTVSVVRATDPHRSYFFRELGLSRSFLLRGQLTYLDRLWLRQNFRRAIHVHCESCGTDFICTRAHAAQTIFPAGNGRGFFPCPDCNALVPRMFVLVVISPCTMDLILLDQLEYWLLELHGGVRRL